MNSTATQTRQGLFARTALSAALALGVVAGGAMLAEPAAAKRNEPAAPRISFSPGFAKAAAALDKAVTEARTNPAVAPALAQLDAATTAEARATAGAAVDAALGGAKAQLPAVIAAATTPGDKLKAGEITRNVGVLTGDITLQHQGLVGMLQSGAMAPESTGQVNFLAGVTAYQLRNYAGAITYLRPAFDSGYRDANGLLMSVLGDSYKRTNNMAAALELAQKDIADATAAGKKPSDGSLRTALQAAYDGRNAPAALSLAAQLVRNYPNKSSWASSITVVRALGNFPVQETLDLMRLMDRTGSFADERDYVEYLQAADARRFPGEALRIIQSGIAAGKLRTNDPFIAEARNVANGRLAADRASLGTLERDARAASASGAMVSGAADAFLSYGEAAKAEALYAIALNKPGADAARLLTRMGIAQVDQGNFAGAQATFARVQGIRKPIADLWAAYAASKAAPAS